MGQVDIYANFFGILTSLEGMTDDQLDKELESRGGKHPKWVPLTLDENFRADFR